MSKSKERIAGALYGFAIGDAMGATTEFMSAESIKKKYGVVKDIKGGGWLQLKAGEVTDDTQMMECVMEALQESDGKGIFSFADTCANNFINWMESGPKDIGMQCMSGLSHYQTTVKIKQVHESACGNGGLMRALPCALVDNLEYNLIQNDFTHGNTICRTALSVYHNMVVKAIRCGKTMNVFHDKAEPSGYVVSTLWNVGHWTMRSKDFESALIPAVNDGGDADTIGALVGGLAGAMYGVESIPDKWIKKLNPATKKKIEKFIDFAVAKRIEIGYDKM